MHHICDFYATLPPQRKSGASLPLVPGVEAFAHSAHHPANASEGSLSVFAAVIEAHFTGNALAKSRFTILRATRIAM
jgi:hypothetical protein